MEARVCFEYADGGIDNDGNPCPCGLAISIGDAKEDYDYADMVKGLSEFDIQQFFDKLGFKSIDASRLTIITPEEYDRLYGGGE